MTNLAELQIQRERLKAEEARDEYAAALAESVTHLELARAAVAVREVIAQALSALADRLEAAVAGEHDETRVHYLMSDAIHDALTQLGVAVERAAVGLPMLGERVKAGMKPRDLLTVSQWADRHRWVMSGTNVPGKWKTLLTPYLREIQDALSEHSAVRTVVFIKSSGVGGSEVIYNWLGYVMHHLGNKDLLMVVPTLELRDRSMNPRITKTIEETPALAELVSTATRSKANRGDLLEYGARARIIKAGANSPDSLRSDHLPYVICDEVDAFPWDVGGEGDPMTLIENRQRTFSRAKTYLVSTPVREQESRIAQAYELSDRRRYHVPCPHCGEFQTLDFGSKTTHGLHYRTDRSAESEGGAPVVIDAWYVCQHCGAEISEGHKTAMLAAGEWRAERPHVKLVRGYHINALYAPIGLGLGWKQVAQKWVDCQGDTSKLKAFTNTFLGEVWKEQGDSIEDMSLISRAEDYTLASLLADGKVYRITVGTDVQKHRIEFSVVAWGKDEEAWLVAHVIVIGDTTMDDTWAECDTGIAEFRPAKACVDSGYNTSYVYAFCATRPWAVPIKGISGAGRPLVEDEKKRKQRARRRRKVGTLFEPLGVDQGKAIIYSRLKIMQPGPGYIHFPRDTDFDDEYFAQIAAEKLVTRMQRGRPYSEWVAIRPRNEALDCLNYALAAHRLCGPLPDAPLKPFDLPASVELIDKPSTPTAAAPSRPAAPTPSPIASSSWSRRL